MAPIRRQQLFTTWDEWKDFQPYFFSKRGQRNVPVRYLGSAQWRNGNCGEGYYAKASARASRYYPVDFNFEHTCWCEVRYDAGCDQIQAHRIAPEDLGCDIYTRDLVHRDQWGQIDGQPTDNSDTEATPKTPAPSEMDESEHLPDQGNLDAQELMSRTQRKTLTNGVATLVRGN